jgi:hypothetical protein
MAKKDYLEGSVEVSKVPDHTDKKNIKVGKPERVVFANMRSKVAFPTNGGVSAGGGGNFYSPELSTDFLDLPQSLDEQREYYRFFYKSEPFVGQAIDLHTELPLSKIRLSMPKAKNAELARRSLEYCERWCRKIGLMQKLMEIVHEYFLLGEVFIFFEDASPDMPREIREVVQRFLDSDGVPTEEWVLRPDADARAASWNLKNYKGWTAIRVLPPEQVYMQSFPFTDEKIIELVPDSKTKDIIGRADAGDLQAIKIVESMPPTVVEAVREGKNIPLNTDPDAGSFVYYMSRKKSPYEPRGHSILQRCMRTLVFRDRLRQAQAQIAARHMTPFRIVYAEGADENDVDELRNQVDMALQDPDYSIIANFQINWDEKGVESRLLTLDGEWELTNKQLFAGLGVTEGLLTGESDYSGNRINLEVINVRYMLLREVIQDIFDENVFKPMCKRMGFIEEDENGEEQVVYPGLSFTRLSLRDNADTFEALFNLYQKGSLDIDVILELLNIDPVMTKQKLQRDMLTMSDSTFNEMLRQIYTNSADKIIEGTDILPRIAKSLGLEYKVAGEKEEGRF